MASGVWSLRRPCRASRRPDQTIVHNITPPMPIDYNFEHTPNFRDVTRTSLVLLKQPLVRSLAKLRRLRKGEALPEGPVVRTAKTFAGVR